MKQLYYVNMGVYADTQIIDIFVEIWANSKEDAMAAVVILYPKCSLYYATLEKPA